MAEHVAHYTDADFDTEVLGADKPVLVDFWAEWCAPCLMMAPVLEQVAAAYQGKLIIGKVNVDENPQTAAKYRISAIPTMIIFSKGKAVKTLMGYRDKSVLTSEINAVLK